MPKLEEKIGVTNRTPGSCDDNSMVRGLVAEAIKGSGKKRDQIAEEMSVLSGFRVSVAMLNDYSADSKSDHRFPLLLARAFCIACNDWTLLSSILNRSGLYVIQEWERPVLELGERVVASKDAALQAEALRDQIVQARRARA
jgi:hypothetical protein